jgi:hypothetical protein
MRTGQAGIFYSDPLIRDEQVCRPQRFDKVGELPSAQLSSAERRGRGLFDFSNPFCVPAIHLDASLTRLPMAVMIDSRLSLCGSDIIFYADVGRKAFFGKAIFRGIGAA